MADDRETGLNIPISAYADKDSAKQAITDLIRGISSSLKDGYIEVPAEVKASFNRGSKELDKAQKDIIDQWEKMSKKGFSSSEEYLNSLVEKYRKFKSLAGKEGKGNSKQSKWLTETIGQAIQPYITQKKELDKIVSSFENSIKESKKITKNSKKTNLPSDKEIEANIKQEQNRRMKGLKSSLPKGLKTNSGADPGRTNEYDLRMSEVSSYRSSQAKQIEESKKIAKATYEKDSLKVDKYNTQKQLLSELEKRHETDEIKGRNTKNFTSQEKALNLSEDIRNNILPELLTQAQTAKDDAEFEEIKQKFLNTIEAVSKLNADAGKSTLNDVTKTVDLIMRKLGFTTSGNIGGTSGDKKDKSKDPRTETLLKSLLNEVKNVEDKIKEETIALENINKKTTKSPKTRKTATTVNSNANKLIGEIANQNKLQDAKLQTIATATDNTQNAIESQTTYDKIENSAERVADRAEAQKNQEMVSSVKTDMSTGFNTDAKADTLIDIVRNILSSITLSKNEEKPKKNIDENKSTISEKQETGLILKGPLKNESVSSYYSQIRAQNFEKRQARLAEQINADKSQLITPDIIQLPEELGNTFGEKLQTTLNKIFTNDTFKKLKSAFDTRSEVERLNSMNADEIARMRAEQISKFGLSSNPKDPTSSGDRILAFRRKLVYGWGQKNNPFEGLQIDKGLGKINLTAITDALQKSIQKSMFKAQTGGIGRNLFGIATGGLGYAFMPSLEKSRSKTDAANQILADIREKAIKVLQDIESKETDLRGLQKTGRAVFDKNGQLVQGKSSNEAQTLWAQLGESQDALKILLADAENTNKVIVKSGGNLSVIFKRLKFLSPILREDNAIVQNINAGLDKNGKVLKYQTRLGETLNYTFQLMSRHVGQVLKSWLLMLNPINIIKKAIGYFGSYSTKWQRTLNVIKYNLHAILEPFMDKVAQFLVNCIGFVDIISQKVQAAFGKIPISLFDQAAAQSQKIKEELEQAANVTAGFDELHDIGSDNSGANDLLGDIYKPQLSQEWIDLANEIGDLFAGLIKGDLGFGEVMQRILKILWDSLATIAKTIWDWFKQTAIGKYITEHWKGILATILAAFLTWKLLKIAGSTLFKALFGKLLEKGVISGIFSKIGGWISNGLSSLSAKGGLLGFVGNFGQGIITAFQTLFAGGKYSLIGTLKEMFTNSTVITEAGSWGSMIGFALTKGLLAALAGYTTYKVIDHFGDNLADKTSYNLGIEYAGGKEEDKKGTFLDSLGAIGGGAAGGAITGAIVGGPIGAAIGAVIGGVAGTIQTVLRPALEGAEVAARSLNGELQSVSFNEGQVQVFQEQSDALKEQLDLLKQSLDISTQSVYEQGEKLGISKTRMDELVESTENGSFTTDMLTGSETSLAGSLTDLAQKQEHTREVTEKLEEAQKKLLKAQSDLSIAQDIEAGNFELAAARIELAEAQGVYSTEEATDRRIELFEKCADEEKANLLQDLTSDQKKRMTDLNNLTDIELAKLNTAWQNSGETARNAILDGLDENTQAEFKRRMDQIDKEIESHQGFWQGVGDTLAEIFSFGHANTWTYNGEVKYEDEVRKGKIKIQKYDIGTNYVPNDGLAYLHQGEAVIPKKYNQPYSNGMSAEERNYMTQMITTLRALDNTMREGININGQFIQRGSDLVAVVNKTKSQTGADLLSNASYAR